VRAIIVPVRSTIVPVRGTIITVRVSIVPVRVGPWTSHCGLVSAGPCPSLTATKGSSCLFVG
jgi:hypothetical protein